MSLLFIKKVQLNHFGRKRLLIVKRITGTSEKGILNIWSCSINKSTTSHLFQHQHGTGAIKLKGKKILLVSRLN